MLNSLLLALPLSLSTPPQLPLLQTPEGLTVEVVAEVPNARQMALAEDGTLFVGSRGAGHVYAVQDRDQDGIYEHKQQLAVGLNLPTGLALRGNDLYVAEVHRILRFPNILPLPARKPQPEVYFDQLPTERHHGWKYLKVGPDNALYFNIGAPCNICLKPDPFATLVRLGQDKQLKVIARGIRNSVGFTWHANNRLWFTDNGRDHMGDDLPSDELNVLTKEGQHFGYPFEHADQVNDPVYGSQGMDDYQTPAYNLGAHVAPLGLTFYQGEHLPETDVNTVFIAEHGSWNRSSKVGYRVVKLQVDGDKVIDHQIFVQGWLQGEQHWGRPADVLVDHQGRLLISDDYAGLIYRISKI